MTGPSASGAAPGLLDLLGVGGPRLTVGMLTADLGALNDDLAIIAAEGAQLVHIDVMDGVFCPMLTLGAPVVRAMRTPMLKDVHLMVDDPLGKVAGFVAAGADLLTFHIEGARQPRRVLTSLGGAINVNDPERGVLRGVALTPSTPVSAIEPLLGDLEYVLILAVDPGWGGQGFAPSTPGRVARARELIEASGRRILLGIDGGVTRDNIGAVLGLGADIVVTGSAIYDGKAVAQNARFMLDQAAAARA
jgi:ribulose-phosphate 3-epimerase